MTAPTASDDALARLFIDNDDVATALARHVHGYDFSALRSGEVEAARRLLLDCVGAGLAAVDAPGCVEMLELVRDWGSRGNATVFGRGDQVAARDAVAVNGSMCRALEVDDVHEVALIHPSAAVVPAVLAAVETASNPVSGPELLTAVAVGIDILTRMSLAPTVDVGGPGYRPRGMSCTWQLGTLAAAAVVARLHGGTAGTILSAMGLAYSNAAGNQQVIADHSLGVRLQQGLSGSNGVVAASLALRGVAGPHHPLEGKFGYYPMYANGRYDRDVIVEDLGHEIHVTGVSIKPYPCCKYTHTTIAAALAAIEDPNFDASSIEGVTVRMNNAEYFSLVCDPLEEKRRPSSAVEAQFSMPYVVATALLRGRVALEHFDIGAAEMGDVRSLAERVTCELDTDGPAGRTLPSPGVVEVHLRGGEVICAEAALAPGHPDRPFGWDETVEKFCQVVSYPSNAIPPQQAREFAARLEHLEELEDARNLVREYLVWT